MPRTYDGEYERPRFTLASLFTVVAFLAICFSLLFSFHSTMVYIVDACIVALLLMTVFGVRKVVGIAIPRLTVVEWLAIIPAVVILNSFLFPPVSSHAHSRGRGSPSNAIQRTVDAP
jgi:hypothetical protein